MRKSMVMFAVLAIITCLGVISAPAVKSQPRYSYIDLGALGGPLANSYVSAVNLTGTVAGESQTNDPAIDHAFLWTKALGLRDLGGLSRLKNGAVVNLDRSNAWGLDMVAGTVVGEAWNADHQNGGPNPMIRAFLWKPGTGMVDLGALSSGKNSTAYWCNDLGWVVGSAETARRGVFHAFYCTSNKVLQDIDKRASKQSAAWFVNNLGQIVGVAETTAPGIYRGFFWQKGMTAMKFLATLPGGTSSEAYALNYWSICGTSDNGSGATRAVMWFIYRAGMLDLGDLGGASSYAWNCNDWGQVVGCAETATAGTYHAFIWNDTEGIRDLNSMVTLPPRITLITASSINNVGQILAQAEEPGGICHVFLLSPIQNYVMPK